jgi:ABC-2 type transport system permease protein
MLSKIAGFEIRYQLFSPTFIAVFAIFFLLVFGGVTVDGIQVGGGGNTNINSPNALTINVLIFSLIGGFIPAVFLSSGILRDQSYKTQEMFFSRPIRESGFVLGRFIGGFIATALCFASVPLAFLIGSFMPWLDQELVGPTDLGFYLYIYAAFGLVNMWVMGTILFTIANFTRSMMGVWAAFLGLLVAYLLGSSLAGNEPALRDMISLVDPFGFNTWGEATRYWTAFEQNSQVVPFEGTMLLNRLIWVGVGTGLLILNVVTFRFRKSATGKAGKSKNAAAPAAAAITDIALMRVTPTIGGRSARQQFFARLSFEVKGVVFNFAFWIILALGLLNTVPGFFFGNGIFGTSNFPSHG